MLGKEIVFVLILVIFIQKHHCYTDGTLRMHGGDYNEGILEIYHRSRWGAVCDDGWGSEESIVACKQLGFISYVSYEYRRSVHNSFWLDNVICNGNESSLLDCRNNGWGVYDCGSSEGLYLNCQADDGTLRMLEGGYDQGILEIYHSRRWGAVCGDGWGSQESIVACKKLGFINYVSYRHSRTISHSFWLDDVVCNGNEPSLLDCSNDGWGVVDCRSSHGLYLTCQAGQFGIKTGTYTKRDLQNFAILTQSTTLFCSPSSKWSFSPYGHLEEEEDLSSLASRVTSYRYDKRYYNSYRYISYYEDLLPISTSKLGYYSCNTQSGQKRYTIRLTKPASEEGCKRGYCFGIFLPDRAINWATAQSNCKSWGGDLASIRSEGEEDFILSLGDSSFGSCWLGHHDRYNEAGTNASLFVSVGGSSSLYRNFFGNQPDDRYGNEDCVMLRDWNGGGWSDTSCSSTLSCYVCGKPNCRSGSCFEVVTPNSGINWESAQSQCELRGGSLASIRSEPEEKFLLNLMTDINTTCLIGLNDRNREAGTNPNRYVWEDGSRSIYRHFRNEVGTLNRDCVALSLEYGSWINADCNDFYTCYICRGTEVCPVGYYFHTTQGDCLDVDECSTSNDCEYLCTNTVGSYICSCRDGYYLSNFTSCDLIYLNIVLNGTTNASDSINLTWDTIYRPMARLNKLNYSVWIRDVTFETNGQFVIKDNTTNVELKLDGLFPYKIYEIYIIGRDNDTQKLSNVVTVRTLTDRPSSAPTHLTASATSPITVRLNWIPPRRETHNGVLTQYSILFSRTDRKIEQNVSVNASLQSYDVTNLAEYTNYTFRVAAVNSAGTGVYSQYVSARTLEGIPTASPVIIFLAKSPTSISLQLRPPNNLENINGVITFYQLAYNGNIVDNEVRSLKCRPISVEYYLVPINASLTRLEEGIEYNIKARVHTSVGEGPYSSFVVISTTEIAPTGPPLNVTILILLSTSLTLSWSPPELNLQNGIITGYLVHYHGLLVDVQERNFTIRSSLTNLTRLEEGALYVITICALNKAGVGPCFEVMNRTREIPPSQSPQNVEVEVSGSTSLLVTWEPLSLTEENGGILRYNISVVGRGHDTAEYELITNSTATYLTIENLQEGNMYSVSVAAVNSAGTGPYSNNITVVTYDDIPSAAPGGVFGIGTETLILLTWDPPNATDRNGEITKYEVMYFGTTVDRKRRVMLTTKLRAVIGNLKSGDIYHIKIRAYTSQGPGPFSVTVPVKTYESNPTAPPTNLTLIYVSSIQIRVTWQDVPLTHKNGVIIGYDICISTVNDPNNEEIFAIREEVRTYTIKELEPNTSYLIKIRARTLPGPGPYSQVISATTLKGPSTV